MEVISILYGAIALFRKQSKNELSLSYEMWAGLLTGEHQPDYNEIQSGYEVMLARTVATCQTTVGRNGSTKQATRTRSPTPGSFAARVPAPPQRRSQGGHRPGARLCEDGPVSPATLLHWGRCPATPNVTANVRSEILGSSLFLRETVMDPDSLGL